MVLKIEGVLQLRIYNLGSWLWVGGGWVAADSLGGFRSWRVIFKVQSLGLGVPGCGVLCRCYTCKENLPDMLGLERACTVRQVWP